MHPSHAQGTPPSLIFAEFPDFPSRVAAINSRLGAGLDAHGLTSFFLLMPWSSSVAGYRAAGYPTRSANDDHRMSGRLMLVCDLLFCVVPMWCCDNSILTIFLKLVRSLGVSSHSCASVAVIDASSHPDHSVHAGFIGRCHLH